MNSVVEVASQLVLSCPKRVRNSLELLYCPAELSESWSPNVKCNYDIFMHRPCPI